MAARLSVFFDFVIRRLTDARVTCNISIPITTPDRLRLKDSGRDTPSEILGPKYSDWTSSTELALQRRSPSSADDETGMLDFSSPKLDRSEILNSELRIGYSLNSSNWRNSNWKPNSCLIPTLSLDDPLTQPWEILSEATPSRALEITVKPKLLPGRLKTRDLTSRDWTTRHHIARVDIARLVSLCE